MDEKLQMKDMAGLDLPALKRLLDKQVALKRKYETEQCVLKVVVGTYTTNIHNIRKRISALSPLDEPLDIADHAVLRYLERVCGIDMNVIRAEIDSPGLRECIHMTPTGRHLIDGVTYVTQDKKLVTIIYDGEPKELE